MNQGEILNGTIIDTYFGEEHGCLTLMVTIEGDGWGCGFGGYNLDSWFATKHSPSVGMGSIIELLKTLELDKYERLKGTHVRVKFYDNTIVSVGHLIKDKWFSFKEYFANNTKEETK